MTGGMTNSILTRATRLGSATLIAAVIAASGCVGRPVGRYVARSYDGPQTVGWGGGVGAGDALGLALLPKRPTDSETRYAKRGEGMRETHAAAQADPDPEIVH